MIYVRVSPEPKFQSCARGDQQNNDNHQMQGQLSQTVTTQEADRGSKTKHCLPSGAASRQVAQVILSGEGHCDELRRHVAECTWLNLFIGQSRRLRDSGCQSY